MKRRFNDCNAIENEDFEGFTENLVKSQAGRPQTDHIIKLDTAKEVEYLLNFLFLYSLIGFSLTYRTIFYIEIIKTLIKHIYVW